MGEGDNFVEAIAETSNAYIVAGNSDSATGDFNDFPRGFCGFIAWLDKSTGALKKIKPFQANGMGFITGVTVTENDTLLVLGQKGTDSNFIDYIWYFKLDSAGNFGWQKTIATSAYQYSLAPHFITTKRDQGIIMLIDAGFDSSSGAQDTFMKGDKGWQDAMIINMDRNGNIIWKKTYGGSQGDALLTIKEEYSGDAPSGFLCTGTTLSNDGDIPGPTHGLADWWAIRVDDTGKLLWSKIYGGDAYDFHTSTAFTNDGGAVLYGYTDSRTGDCSMNSIGAMEVMLIRIDSTGAKKWMNMYTTGDGPAESGSITTTYDSSFAFAMTGFSCYITGSCNPNGLAENIVFAKLANDGEIIYPAENNISIYPNPVTDLLTIAFQYPNFNDLQTELFDIAGRPVFASFTNTVDNTYQLDLSRCKPGIYILKLKTPKTQITKKIVIAPKN